MRIGKFLVHSGLATNRIKRLEIAALRIRLDASGCNSAEDIQSFVTRSNKKVPLSIISTGRSSDLNFGVTRTV